MHSLLNGGKSGPEGIPVVKMAKAIGNAIETEVVSQRRIKERYHTALSAAIEESLDEATEEDHEEVIGDGDIQSITDAAEMKQENEFVMDKWAFSASHLKLFWDDLKRMGMGKNKRSPNKP
ncbi:MAG: hypothetical protein SGARI_003750 [Bacillariaceae sp.]